MNSEQFSESDRKNMDAAMRLAQLSIENSMKIMAALSELANDLIREGVANAKEQAGATDAQEILRLRTRYAQQTTQKMIETALKIAEIGNETRVEFSRLLTEQLAAGGHGLMDAFQSFFKVLPAQTADAMESMQLAVDRANRAFEQITLVHATAFDDKVRPAKVRRPQKKAVLPPPGIAAPKYVEPRVV